MIKRLGEVHDLIKPWHVYMKLSKDVIISSAIVQEEYSLEMPNSLIIVEEAEMIKMVLPIHIEDKKIVLEEDLIEKVKFIREQIECQLGKGKSCLIIVRSWKSP